MFVDKSYVSQDDIIEVAVLESQQRAQEQRKREEEEENRTKPF